jgi:hypothetical protein
MESSDCAAFASSFSTKDVRDHYDRFAWVYRRYWGDHIHHGLFLNGQENGTFALPVGRLES